MTVARRITSERTWEEFSEPSRSIRHSARWTVQEVRFTSETYTLFPRLVASALALLCALPVGWRSMRIRFWPAVLPALDAEAITLCSDNIPYISPLHSFAGPCAPEMATQANQTTTMPNTAIAGTRDGKAGRSLAQCVNILDPGFFQATGHVASPVFERYLDRHASLETKTTRFNVPGTLSSPDTCIAGPSSVQKSSGEKGTRMTGIGNPA
jgi:hypothetical protein